LAHVVVVVRDRAGERRLGGGIAELAEGLGRGRAYVARASWRDQDLEAAPAHVAPDVTKTARRSHAERGGVGARGVFHGIARAPGRVGVGELAMDAAEGLDRSGPERGIDGLLGRAARQHARELAIGALVAEVPQGQERALPLFELAR